MLAHGECTHPSLTQSTRRRHGWEFATKNVRELLATDGVRKTIQQSVSGRFDDLLGQELQHIRVDAVALISAQSLTTELQQGTTICERLQSPPSLRTNGVDAKGMA